MACDCHCSIHDDKPAQTTGALIELPTDQTQRLMDLEKENARLRRLVANQALEREILKEATAGNF